MTNHVRRTMHILDVTSSVSRFSKCTEIVGGAYSTSPAPLVGLRDLLLRPLLLSRGEEGMGQAPK